MSGILTEEIVDRARAKLFDCCECAGTPGYTRAALEAVLPMIGEAIAKKMYSEWQFGDLRTYDAPAYVRTLTASVGK